MFELCKGALNVPFLYEKWYESVKNENLGALVSFCGVVRDEDQIRALYFDIYEPLLKAWFDKWQERVQEQGVKLFFAHSFEEVALHQSSYLAAVASKNRRLGLELIDEFVEDFKHNAPIWKYDVKGSQKIYAKSRSIALKGAGLLV